jgi:hypothetical protein
MFLIGLSPTYAQIGELGVYGSVPEEDAEDIYYVYLQDLYPPMEGTVDHFLPVNGLKNFNFYYSPGLSNGIQFLPAGTYRVHYYGADKTTHYGYDQVTYSPNSGHTNGVEVRPFNNPPATPRGVHGIIYGRLDSGDYPLENAQVLALGLFTSALVQSRANANGYFSIYYKNGYGAQFLPVYFGTSPPAEYYHLSISGSVNGCFFSGYYSDVLWEPQVPNDPDDAGYFVTDAEWDTEDIFLSSTNCS